MSDGAFHLFFTFFTVCKCFYVRSNLSGDSRSKCRYWCYHKKAGLCGTKCFEKFCSSMMDVKLWCNICLIVQIFEFSIINFVLYFLIWCHLLAAFNARCEVGCFIIQSGKIQTLCALWLTQLLMVTSCSQKNLSSGASSVNKICHTASVPSFFSFILLN